MPVDTRARYYQWFMSSYHNERIVGYEWHPDGGEIISSLTPGRLVFMHRAEPDDTWEPPIEVAASIPWAVAQSLTRREGFHVEIALYD